MKKQLFTLLVLIGFLLTACGPGDEESGIETHEATMEAAALGGNSELFMEMHNHGGGTDQLTSVSSDAADAAELHNGDEIVQDIPVYANTDLELTPEGYHVVLVGLKQELHDGDEIEIVLHFRDHEDISVKVTVGEIGEHGHDDGGDG
jgi:periplasmic copper chaperone A